MSRPVLKGSLAGLAVLLLLLGSALFTTKVMADRYNAAATKVVGVFPEEEGRPPKPGKEVQTVLLLSTDRDEESVSYQTSHAGKWSSVDLVRFPADNEAIYFISIPPELLVSLPDGDEVTLAQTKAEGGTRAAVSAVEGLLGARINKLAVVPSDKWPILVEAVGGAEIAERVGGEADWDLDEYTPVPKSVDGPGAAARLASASEPCERILRRQEIVGGLTEAALQWPTLLRPTKVIRIVDVLGTDTHTSKDLSFRFMLRMFVRQGAWGGVDLEFLTLPSSAALVGQRGDQDKQDTPVVANSQGLSELRQALADDDLGSLVGSPLFDPCRVP